MGNHSSSPKESESDFEHEYKFHTCVLHHGTSDGFESDNEDSFDFPPVVFQQQEPSPEVPTNNTPDTQPKVPPSTTPDTQPKVPINTISDTQPISLINSSEGSSILSNCKDGNTRESDFCFSEANILPVSQCETILFEPKKDNDNLTENIPISCGDHGSSQSKTVSKGRRNLSQFPLGRPDTKGETTDHEDAYKTANEDSIEDDEAGDDNDSFSTITPPRTRPQSDSEISVGLESESENESHEGFGVTNTEDTEDISSSESQDSGTVAEENLSSASGHFEMAAALNRRGKQQKQTAFPLSVHQNLLPSKLHHMPDNYRQARKRQASPIASSSHSPPCLACTKSSLLCKCKNHSSSKIRYAYIDSDSEPVVSKMRKIQDCAYPSPHMRSLRESKRISAQSLQETAHKTADKFLETSEKILRSAKSAVREFRAYASKQQAKVMKVERELPLKKRKLSESGRIERIGSTLRNKFSRKTAPCKAINSATLHKQMESRGVAGMMVTRSKQMALQKEMIRDNSARASGFLASVNKDTDHPEITVRKNGGFLRKFTHSHTIRGQVEEPLQPSTSVVASSSVEVPSLPLTHCRPTLSNNAALSTYTSNTNHGECALTDKVVETNCANPFESVRLVAPSLAVSESPSGSIDSISRELSKPFSKAESSPQNKNPLTSLTSNTSPYEELHPVSFASGSVWARVNMRSNQSMEAASLQESPTPGTIAQRIQTPSRSKTQALITIDKGGQYPGKNTPLVPSLTLTGQYAQNERFSFLLEDILQITVSIGTITSTTSSVIVISTDAHLQYQTPDAQNVAAAAGPGFFQASQQFLVRQPSGLQACEVLATPAGGQLSSLTSHILQVIVPTCNSENQWKKMLLCTYLNCLKHVSDKLRLRSVTFPLIGAGAYSADICIQIFFDSLLVYLAERSESSSLHRVHLVVDNPAVAQFAASVLEARLETIVMNGVDSAMAETFQEYFGIPDFIRNTADSMVSTPGSADRNYYGKPAVKRRHL